MPRTARPFAPPLASLAVLVFAAWQGFVTLGNTPAFNSNLRVEVPGGGTRPLLTSAMYDRAAYLYQTAYGYAHSMGSSIKLGADSSTVTLETIKRNITLSREHAEASLNGNPANAHAWALIATSRRATGQSKAALEAYRNSVELAPYSDSLSMSRLRFISRTDEETQSLPTVQAGIEQDIRVLVKNHPKTSTFVSALFPEFVIDP